MKTTMMYLVIMFTFTGFSPAPERTITGKVISADTGNPIASVNVLLKGTMQVTATDKDGNYALRIPSSGGVLFFSFIGYESKTVTIGKKNIINVQLTSGAPTLEEVVVEDVRGRAVLSKPYRRAEQEKRQADVAYSVMPPPMMHMPAEPISTETYAGSEENIFRGANETPLSTFSIDVDAASYSNLRRFINNGQQPPADAVRIEEMINYFSYDYAAPADRHPFSVITDISDAPWNPKHHLVRIGLQGRKVPVENLPASNLVFLIDVSGSMNQQNKLPLVKRSFQMLLDQLRAEDHVAIVVYAGAASVLLEPTAGSEKRKILAAIDKLQAGGSTAGGAGLHMAYDLAKEHYNTDGNNRIILATDGDFNVGESSNEAMEDLIEAKREEGVFLTVLGFGMGNIKDSKMEILADKGNGNYAYIDNFNEARKVLVSEFGGTLFTIAKDVKLQVEFNPARVQAYRLIGYENRILKDEDFNNDRKDAGDLGSGHTVTALYEIIPVGVTSDFYAIDNLKYQPAKPAEVTSRNSEWLTVKLRYKDPKDSKSKLLEHVLDGKPSSFQQSDNDFRWAASVASFGMLLKHSQYLDNWGYSDLVVLAENARGKDQEGYRSEFINLVKTCALINQRQP